MDYNTVLDALQEKHESKRLAHLAYCQKHPRKGQTRTLSMFHLDLSQQLQRWMVKPNGVMPFSEKQAFYVSKCFPEPVKFWDWWRSERRKRGLWDNHERGCKCERGLDIRERDSVVVCRKCGAELGQFIPTAEVDPVYKATSESADCLEAVDLDAIEMFEGVRL